MWISYTNCESHTQTYRPVGSFSTTSPTSASDFETTPKSIAKVKNWEREREREIAFKRKKERKRKQIANPIKEVVWFWRWSENEEAVVHSTGQPTCWSRSRPWYRERPSTGGPKLERRCNCRRADPPSKATERGRPRQLPGGALASQASRLLSWRLSCSEFGGFIFFFFFFFFLFWLWFW